MEKLKGNIDILTRQEKRQNFFIMFLKEAKEGDAVKILFSGHKIWMEFGSRKENIVSLRYLGKKQDIPETLAFDTSLEGETELLKLVPSKERSEYSK